MSWSPGVCSQKSVLGAWPQTHVLATKGNIFFHRVRGEGHGRFSVFKKGHIRDWRAFPWWGPYQEIKKLSFGWSWNITLLSFLWHLSQLQKFLTYFNLHEAEVPNFSLLLCTCTTTNLLHSRLPEPATDVDRGLILWDLHLITTLQTYAALPNILHPAYFCLCYKENNSEVKQAWSKAGSE